MNYLRFIIFKIVYITLLFVVFVRGQSKKDIIASLFPRNFVSTTTTTTRTPIPSTASTASTNEGFVWIPDNYELVSSTSLRSITALEKCGEGSTAKSKVCVPYHRCDVNTGMVTNESQTNNVNVDIDIRGGGDCEDYLDVCCSLPDNNEIPTTTTTSKPSTKSTPLPNKDSYCGIRNVFGLDFTIKGCLYGEYAEYGEFPWIVNILRTDYNPFWDDTPSICGGSLIAPQIVLTGAHCVAKYKDDLTQIKVRAGEWDTLTEKEKYPYQERGVTEVFIHEEFNDRTLANDIALVLLERHYAYAPNIGTICLPQSGEVINSKECFTGGWGQDEFENINMYSNILKKIQVPTVPFDRCQSEMRKTRLGAYFNLHKSFICAGEKGRDACTGDGGSPLVCPDPNNPKRYVQVGIVAWGIGCGNVPGVYADVAFARNWIDTKLAEIGYETTSYTR